MIYFILNETFEITYFTVKSIIKCAYNTYRYFKPEPDVLMIEMKELKSRIVELEKQAETYRVFQHPNPLWTLKVLTKKMEAAIFLSAVVWSV